MEEKEKMNRQRVIKKRRKNNELDYLLINEFLIKIIKD